MNHSLPPLPSNAQVTDPTSDEPAQNPPRTAVGRVLSPSPDGCPSPGPGGRSLGQGAAAAGDAARSVRLAWQDPVTGERLYIAMMATPTMIQRLQSEGFAPEAEITRSAG